MGFTASEGEGGVTLESSCRATVLSGGEGTDGDCWTWAMLHKAA